MNPVMHPITKTSIELRRSIGRLTLFRDQNPNDKHAESVDALIKELEDAHSHIPKELKA